MAAGQRPEDLVTKVGVDPTEAQRGFEKYIKELVRAETATGKSSKKMAQDTGGLGKAIDGLRKHAVALGAALVTGITIRGLANMTQRVTAAGDTIQKLSERLGFSTEGLSELGFAAERSGLGVEQFRKAMEVGTRNLEMYRQRGTGPLADALPALSRGFRELVAEGTPLERLIPRLADEFQDLTEGQRFFVAGKIFGEEGARISGLLSEGSEGIAALRKEAQALGATVTREFGQLSATVQDAFTNVSTAIDKMQRDIVTAFGPEGIQLMADWAIATTRYVSDVALAIRSKLKGDLRAAVLEAEELERNIENVKLVMESERVAAEERAAAGAPAAAAAPSLGLGGGGGLAVLTAIPEQIAAATNAVAVGVGDWVNQAAAGAGQVGMILADAAAQGQSEWSLMVDSMAVTTSDLLFAVQATFTTISSTIGQVVARAIFHATTVEEAAMAILEAVVTQVIQSLIALAIQELIYLVISLTTTTKRLSVELAAAAALVYAAAFLASAELGIVGVAAAPGVAAGAVAAMLSGASGAAGAGSSTAAGLVAFGQGGLAMEPTIALVGERGPERITPIGRKGQGDGGVVNVFFDGRQVARALMPHVGREVSLRVGAL